MRGPLTHVTPGACFVRPAARSVRHRARLGHDGESLRPHRRVRRHKARLFFEKMLGYANANSHASLEQREGTRDRAISCDLLSSRHTPAVS